MKFELSLLAIGSLLIITALLLNIKSILSYFSPLKRNIKGVITFLILLISVNCLLLYIEAPVLGVAFLDIYIIIVAIIGVGLLDE